MTVPQQELRAKSGDREALAAIVDWLNPQIVHDSCINRIGDCTTS